MTDDKEMVELIVEPVIKVGPIDVETGNYWIDMLFVMILLVTIAVLFNRRRA